ncbi:MAG: hypothetical protein M1821_007944 [Bathelium mastoideum]|nr:MAG: hypothetical protein M1821_007944 [Bathelium mastoideum]
MKGVADGARVPFLSILALNVRTELAYGLFQSDGCTALSWHASAAEPASFLAQNWDWQSEQKPNIIALRIQPIAPHPRQQQQPHSADAPVLSSNEEGEGQLPSSAIHMVTEAGIIGKIGLNAAGVGVCLNAIRARGVRFDALPCHLALRRCLEARSREEAVTMLEREGVAAACHILVADGNSGGVGLECSAQDVVRVAAEGGVVTHTNHYILPHQEGVKEQGAWKDSPVRLERISQMVGSYRDSGREPSAELIGTMLGDEMGYPTSINRHETPDSTVATLFTIVMDLKRKVAKVTLGRPTEVEGALELDPGKP